MTLLDKLTARPERGLFALCIVQFVLWTVAPAISHTAMPLDMVEMYVWGREWVVATFKHPNLPGLMLEAARRVTGSTGTGSLAWTGFAVSQICIIAAYGAVFALGRDMLGARKALAGTLLLTGIYYFSWSSPEMNHNVAQMPLWALVILFLWRAVERGGLGWWLGLGLLGGLSLWAKYSSAVLLLICLLWLFADARARAHLRRAGPWLALAAFAAMAAPQMLFLLETDFLSLRYAQDRASGTAGHWVGFLPTQIANHLVMVIMLAVAGLFGRGALNRPEGPTTGGDARARRFLIVFGLGPVMLTVVAAAITGSGLKDMWGMPMFNLSGLLALAFLRGRFTERSLRRIAVFTACLLVILPTGYAGHLLLADSYRERPKRGNWPQQEIASQLLEAYRLEIGAYPDIIAGPIWEAGLVATGTTQAPSVLIDGDPQKSHWLSAADARRRGMLVVWNSNRVPPEALVAELAAATVRHAQFRWSDNPEAEVIGMSYAVLPPDG